MTSRSLGKAALVAAVLASPLHATDPCPPIYWVGEAAPDAVKTFLFVPAGFGPDETWRYRCAVDRIVSKLASIQPYSEFHGALRFARADLASSTSGPPVCADGTQCFEPYWGSVCPESAESSFAAESGTTIDGLTGPLDLPVVDFSFCCSDDDEHGGIGMDQVEVARQMGQCMGSLPDAVIVLANTQKLAGWHYPGTPPVDLVTLGTIDANAADPLAHELGHVFKLADENENAKCVDPDDVCHRANVTKETGCTGGIPWADCCDGGACLHATTDCAAQNTAAPYPVVGLHRIACTDCYRPSLDCRMSYYPREYCPVCRTALRRALFWGGSGCVPTDCEKCIDSTLVLVSYDASNLGPDWRAEVVTRRVLNLNAPPLPLPELLARLRVVEAYAEMDLGGVLAEVPVGAVQFGVPRRPFLWDGPPGFDLRKGFPYGRLTFRGMPPGRVHSASRQLPPLSEVADETGAMRWKPLRMKILGYVPGKTW